MLESTKVAQFCPSAIWESPFTEDTQLYQKENRQGSTRFHLYQVNFTKEVFLNSQPYCGGKETFSPLNHVIDVINI